VERSEKSGSLWLLLVVAVPFLYVLSCGPAIYLIEKTHMSPDIFQKIYTPLIWLHDRTLMKKPLEAYAEFWEELAR